MHQRPRKGELVVLLAAPVTNLNARLTGSTFFPTQLWASETVNSSSIKLNTIFTKAKIALPEPCTSEEVFSSTPAFGSAPTLNCRLPIVYTITHDKKVCSILLSIKKGILILLLISRFTTHFMPRTKGPSPLDGSTTLQAKPEHHQDQHQQSPCQQVSWRWRGLVPAQQQEQLSRRWRVV